MSVRSPRRRSARSSAASAGSVEVLLLRHAATSWNDERRFLGWADRPLTPAGREAAAAWAQRVGRAGPRLSAVCCSDLARAGDTARIIAAALGLGDVRELRGLREQDQGEWTGLTKEQIKLRWPERLRERPRRPVGGETPETVLRRALTALGTLAAEHAGGCVVAVAHSGVIRTLEQAMSVAAPPVPHLEGRWLTVSAGTESPLELAVGSLRAGELTAGRSRLVLAGAAGRPGPVGRSGSTGRSGSARASAGRIEAERR